MQEDSGRTNRDAQSGTGMAPNVAGALSYVLGLVTGVVFLLIEKDKFVRFHAYQSIFLSVAWIAFWVVFNILETIFWQISFLGFIAAIIGILLSLVLGLGMLVLVIVLIIKAYQGEQWKVPYIGNMAERYASRS